MRLIPTVGEYLPLIAGAFLVAALLSLVLTPLVRRVAIRLGNVDHPGGRRVNKAPVPRGGGVAVAISFLVVALGGTLDIRTAGAVRRELLAKLSRERLAALGVGRLLGHPHAQLDALCAGQRVGAVRHRRAVQVRLGHHRLGKGQF